MKTPEKNQKKQGSSNTPGSKSSSFDKNKNTTSKDSGKGPWKDPDPTDPRRSPEKVNEPYAGTKATFPGSKEASKPQTTPGVKKEKITNAGESEHHIPVNKSDTDKFEDEYEDFELDNEKEEDEEEEDEKGEANSNFEYEEEDEDNQFKNNKIPSNQKKPNEQSKFQQQKNNNQAENKNKSQPPSNKNKQGPQA